MSTQIPSTGFLRLPQIMELFPISKSSWWQGCRSGRYPKPIKLGPRTTVWRAEEIRAFIENATDQQQGKAVNEHPHRGELKPTERRVKRQNGFFLAARPRKLWR